jgi:hypothetical protein
MPTAATTTNAAASAIAPRPATALVRVWFGVLLPPASWVADFLTRYLLIRYSNISDRRWPQRVPTVICVALLLLGAALCRRARRDAAPGSDVATLALWGLGLAAFFLLLLLAQAYPSFVLGVREIT